MLTKHHKWTMTDLPGRKGKTKLTAVSSPAEVIQCLKEPEKTVGASTAGDSGALNVYRDRAGNIRAQFSRYCVTYSDEILPSINAVRKWLKEWWPQTGRD